MSVPPGYNTPPQQIVCFKTPPQQIWDLPPYPDSNDDEPIFNQYTTAYKAGMIKNLKKYIMQIQLKIDEARDEYSKCCEELSICEQFNFEFMEHEIEWKIKYWYHQRIYLQKRLKKNEKDLHCLKETALKDVKDWCLTNYFLWV